MKGRKTWNERKKGAGWKGERHGMEDKREMWNGKRKDSE